MKSPTTLGLMMIGCTNSVTTELLAHAHIKSDVSEEGLAGGGGAVEAVEYRVEGTAILLGRNRQDEC